MLPRASYLEAGIYMYQAWHFQGNSPLTLLTFELQRTLGHCGFRSPGLPMRRGHQHRTRSYRWATCRGNTIFLHCGLTPTFFASEAEEEAYDDWSLSLADTLKQTSNTLRTGSQAAREASGTTPWLSLKCWFSPCPPETATLHGGVNHD